MMQTIGNLLVEMIAFDWKHQEISWVHAKQMGYLQQRMEHVDRCVSGVTHAPWKMHLIYYDYYDGD